MPQTVNDAENMKQAKVKFKQTDEDNIIEGHASVFGNIDEDGEVIASGAFSKTIQERVPKGLVKLLDGHQWTMQSTLGTVIEAREDEKGLWFRAKLASTPRAQEARELMKEGHIDRLSFGFDVVQDKIETRDGKDVRVITEVKLYEISGVPVPANSEARITDVKQPGFTTAQAILELKFTGDQRAAIAGIVASNIDDIQADLLDSIREDMGDELSEEEVQEAIGVVAGIVERHLSMIPDEISDSLPEQSSSNHDDEKKQGKGRIDKLRKRSLQLRGTFINE